MPEKRGYRPRVGDTVHMNTDKYEKYGLKMGVDYRVVDIPGIGDAIVAIRLPGSYLKPKQVWSKYVELKPQCMFNDK